MYAAQPSHLFHNNRDGTFTDVTVAAGMSREFGPALGVSTADFNGDGWIDIYVANDEQPNQLWINQHDGTFKNTGLLSGTALSTDGEAKSSMGVDAADFDNDGDEDLFVTELTGQGANLYVNDGSAAPSSDQERAFPAALPASLPSTGFGTAWIDVDNDGWLDLLTVNGAVTAIEELANTNDPFPLQPAQAAHRGTAGNGEFEDVTARSRRRGVRPAERQWVAARTFGDLDNDGDTDVVVGSNNGPVQLLVNEIGARHHWVGIRPVSEPAGAKASSPRTVQRQDRHRRPCRRSCARMGRTISRRARAEGSYASANDPRVC